MKDSNFPDLTCFVCKKQLDEPKSIGDPWTCPDKECDSHSNDIDVPWTDEELAIIDRYEASKQ